MNGRVLALSGGVGGAKLVLGLVDESRPGDLLVVANTGDDFDHLGYLICPDIDTLLYTLAGVSNPETGWGRADETWTFMETLRDEQPDDAWFLLGDKDMETHRFRARALARAVTLTEVTAQLCRRFGLHHPIVPMSDDPVRTHVLVDLDGEERWLPFQEYFVRYRFQPRVRRIEFRGAADATVPSALDDFLDLAPIRAVVLCPSNPYLSIDPVLAVPRMRNLLGDCAAPIVAISPVVGGRALKGPTAKIMQELGIPADVESIARHYDGLIDGLVIDHEDGHRATRIADLGIAVSVTGTIMTSLQDRRQLARHVLAFAESLQR